MVQSPGEARDFPYYDGEPVRLSLTGWLAVLAFTAAGFAALVGLPTVWARPLAGWTGIALFVLLPLLGFRLAAGRCWSAMFRWPTKRDVWIGLACAPLTLVVSGTVALAMMQVSPTSANPVAALLPQLKGGDLAAFIAGTAPQLLGEELVTVAPLLALLALFHGVFGRARGPAVAAAWIGSALIFGALHLPTYQWHAGQALIIIGAARLALSVPYLITKNLWSSFIAHLTHDWSLFAIVLAAAALRD